MNRVNSHSGFRGLKGLQALWLCLALLPFLAASLMAQGTMLATDGDNRMAVMLCTSEGMVEVLMAPDGTMYDIDDKGADPQDRTVHDPCDWAALHGQPVLDAPPVSAPMPVRRETTSQFTPRVPLHLLKQAVLSPTARGPPQTV